ncbi:MAG: hypothetical protein M3540_08865 [Actinomycetota bacterium]|nr:hypothetical protein [Actinomycetota bacterium]
MRFYPDLPGRRAGTLARDALFVLLLLLLAVLGKRVHDAVDQLSVLGEGVRKAGDAVPIVGDPVKELGERGEDDVHGLANLLGLVTFAIPAAFLCWQYVPARLTHVRRLTAAERVLRGAEPRAVAMRAAFALPYGELLRFTRDPLGDLEAGRYDALVDAALDDAGLRRQRPERVR